MNEHQALQARCTRFLRGHGPHRPQQVLADLVQGLPPDLEPDHYGEGALIAGFEQEMAGLLGQEEAVFMPSGTMCQQIALRIWSERRGSPHVAFHPTCHLEIHEQKAYQLLHGLRGVLVGPSDGLMTLEHLERVHDPLAALLVELPQRHIGGQLPAWDELVAIADWARGRGVALHLDGARLWECKPFYGREYAEIAALFDTVYVSFYKGLGGIAGSALAGPADFIQEARLWQQRHGGRLVRLYPLVLSARRGVALHLDRMEAYHRKAVTVAAALSALPQIEVVPSPPHTNMMHIFLRGDRERLEAAAIQVAQETGTWLFGSLESTILPTTQRLELSVGSATLELADAEITAHFESLLAYAVPDR